MANVQIRKLQDSDEEGARKFVCREYFGLEPLTRALKLDPEVDGNLWLDNVFFLTVNSGVSMAAVDMDIGEIIGIMFAPIIHKQTPMDMPFSLDDPKTRKLARLFEGLVSVHAGENLFEKYRVDRFVSLDAGGVAQKYQKQGITSKMVDMTLDLIRNKNIKLVVAEATGQFSSRLLENFGFQKGNQINYDSMILGGERLVMTEELRFHKGITQYIKMM